MQVYGLGIRNGNTKTATGNVVLRSGNGEQQKVIDLVPGPEVSVVDKASQVVQG